MRTLILVLTLSTVACKGGGANVSVGQDNFQDDHEVMSPVATPIDDDNGCNRQCVRLSDGTWQLTIDCQGEPIRTFIVGVLPPDCDLISELTPIVTTSGGFTGQVVGDVP